MKQTHKMLLMLCLGSCLCLADQLSDREIKQLHTDRARARDRKTFSLFTDQLKILHHPSSSARTRAGAAMNLIRLYEEFADETGRSAALTQLNKHGLTLTTLKKIASAA